MKRATLIVQRRGTTAAVLTDILNRWMEFGEYDIVIKCKPSNTERNEY